MRAELEAFTTPRLRDESAETEEAPAAEATPAEEPIFELKMMPQAETSCPKCHAVIQPSQRGAFYTECRRCGEIIKTTAA